MREEIAERLRRGLRWLRETKIALEKTGVGIENPEALLEVEREIGRVRLLLEKVERGAEDA